MPESYVNCKWLPKASSSRPDPVNGQTTSLRQAPNHGFRLPLRLAVLLQNFVSACRCGNVVTSPLERIIVVVAQRQLDSDKRFVENNLVTNNNDPLAARSLEIIST